MRGARAGCFVACAWPHWPVDAPCSVLGSCRADRECASPCGRFRRVVGAAPSPIIQVGVPIRMFSPAVLLGLAPYNVISVRAGSLLDRLASTGDVLDTWTIVQLVALAVLVMLPGAVPGGTARVKACLRRGAH